MSAPDVLTLADLKPGKKRSVLPGPDVVWAAAARGNTETAADPAAICNSSRLLRIFMGRIVNQGTRPDRKSTRLNSSHSQISYAVFCLKKIKSSVNSRERSGINTI